MIYSWVATTLNIVIFIYFHNIRIFRYAKYFVRKLELLYLQLETVMSIFIHRRAFGKMYLKTICDSIPNHKACSTCTFFVYFFHLLFFDFLQDKF